jgi:hypothetical protein
MSDRRQSRRAPRRTPAAAAAPFTLSTGWAALVMGLLVVLFFHELVVGGKTFVSPDTTAPAGFVRMGEQSLWKDHVYPLWNPYVFLGMPSFGSGAYNPLIYPPDWPLALVAKVIPLPDMTWMLLYYALGGLFAFLLAREWGARPEGALLGAVVFVFAPNLVAVGSHGHGSQLVNSAYLPLMLWLATRWLRRGGLHDLGWLALAGGFQLLRGHVQICFYSWLAVGLYAAVEWVAALRRPGALPGLTTRAAALAAAAALAFGLAGVYNLPLRDYARFSIRGTGDAGGGVGMTYATAWSLAPYELPTLVAPNWTGFGGATYWGGMPFTDYPNAYVGMVAVVLATFAFLANGAPRVFALLLAVGSLFIAFGHHTPLYGFLYAHLPLFDKFRVPVMILLLPQLAIALAVAWGWSAALERGESRGPRLGRLELAVGIALVVALVAATLGRDAWRDAYVRFASSHRAQGAEAAAIAYPAFMDDLLRAALLGLAALACWGLARRGRLPASVASVAVLLLVMIELWPVSGRVMLPVVGPAVERSLDLGRDDVVEFLEQAGPPGSFRVFPLEEYQSNRFAGFGIASVGGYHAAKPRLFQDLYERVILQGNALGFDPAWMRLLNVRFLVSARDLGMPPVHDGSQRVYAYPLALPRATVVGQWQVVAPAKAILDSVRLGTRDAALATFLERDPGIPPSDVTGAAATITAYRLNDVTVEVDTPAPGLLRLADLWAPDWTATVDGRRAEVLKADYLLRAVPVPAGRHTVVFRYASGAMRAGLLVSLGSLVLVLALLGAGWASGRRRRAATPSPEAA